MNVLVTGGAGYIGSHMVRALLRAGHQVTVVDDLSIGHGSTLPEKTAAYVYDVGDTDCMAEVFDNWAVDAVIHFAGLSIVADSIRDPAKYFQNNVASGISLLKSCLDAGVKKFIFSSSAAVYGTRCAVAYGDGIHEDWPTNPVSPYGETKLIFENILARYSAAYGLRSVSLRYFNAAGAADGLVERHSPETHLIPCAIDAALADKPVTIYGTDYPTPDGTAVRDYVHVVDLCEGHLAALRYLEAGGVTDVFNLGSGKGNSVREVIAEVALACDKPGLTVRHEARRAGDPPALVASIDKAARVLDWKPKLSSIDRIVWDAVASRRK